MPEGEVARAVNLTGATALPRARQAELLFSLSFACVLITVGQASLNVALPSIVRSFHAGTLELTWLLLAQNIATAAAILPAGRLADMWSRKRIFVIGLATVGLASLASGFAPNILDLILLRIVAGIGSAFVIATVWAIATDLFTHGNLGFALGVLNMVIGVCAAIGAAVGGILTSYGWQWVFWVNVPAGLLGAMWAARLLPRSSTRSGETIDWSGNGLIILALSGLLLWLSGSRTLGASNPIIVGSLVVFLTCAPLFLFVELRARHPVLDLGLFRNAIFAAGSVTMLLTSAGYLLVSLMLVFYFQGVQGATPAQAGLLVTPLAIPNALVVLLAGSLADRGRGRVVSGVGMLLMAIGSMGIAIFIASRAEYWVLLLAMGTVSLGMGLFGPANARRMMTSVDPDQRGVASATRLLGITIATSITTAVLVNLITGSLPSAIAHGIFAGHPQGLDPTQVGRFGVVLLPLLAVISGLTALAAPLTYLRRFDERPTQSLVIQSVEVRIR